MKTPSSKEYHYISLHWYRRWPLLFYSKIADSIIWKWGGVCLKILDAQLALSRSRRVSRSGRRRPACLCRSSAWCPCLSKSWALWKKNRASGEGGVKIGPYLHLTRQTSECECSQYFMNFCKYFVLSRFVPVWPCIENDRRKVQTPVPIIPLEIRNIGLIIGLKWE